MGMGELGTLFGDPVIKDVPLTDAPLARVIGQLRFAPVTALASGDEVAQEFMKTLANDYPYAEEGHEFTAFFAPGEPVKQANSGKVWRLRSSEGDSVLALSNGALTLEANRYPGRRAFCTELAKLSAVLQQVSSIRTYSRIAVRYSNRLTGEETLRQLSELVRPEMLGLAGAPVATGVRLAYCLSQSLFDFDSGAKILAQWGKLPENASFDPTLTAVQEPSWVLDLDSFEEFSGDRSLAATNPEAVAKAAGECAERAHTFFRWAVTKQFLIHFGGDV